MVAKQLKEVDSNYNNRMFSSNDYNELSLEERKQIFSLYLQKILKKSLSTIGQYVGCHLLDQEVLNVIHSISSKQNLYEVTNLEHLQLIYQECCKLEINMKRHGVYSASILNYIKFIRFIYNDLGESDINIIFNQKIKECVLGGSFSISQLISLIDETGLIYSPTLIKRFAFSLLSKRFLILSGLAGSGKTQLALAFASALIEDDSQMCVVSVGADWTNREPLLGFPNALQEGNYVKPESKVLDLLIEANKQENADKPYFLILDEMNMSYVERYFADFLSSMESHEPIPLWNGSDDSDVPKKVSLSNNLFIIGTINVDETTYMFSPKVLDRANVIEFKISGKDMETFLSEMKPVNRDSIKYKAAGMGKSFVELAEDDELADNHEIKTTLQLFFKQLKQVNAEFGYRSATEIYRFISQADKNDDTVDELELNQLLDCAIVQKLLPKLHGSRKKLEPVLQALWKECFSDAENRETLPITQENVALAIYPLAADKIQRMYEAAYANGFTSFAEA